MEGHKPGSDPRYSCGWHNRKNTFNKERRQFEKMSSFETQAAGLARPGFSGPQLPIPPPEDPEILGCSPPHPHPTALPASGARGTRTGDPSSAAAYFGVTPPRSLQPTPPHRSPRKGFPAESGVAGPGSVARRVRVRDASWERARRRVSRSDSRLGSSALAGPPVASFPVLSPGPHRVETGYLVKRCFWPSRRRGDGRRKAPSPEFFSIKSDKKFREK